MMKKTLLLCFIHGFKGGEDTFGDNYQFTTHLRDLVAQELPKVDVRVLVYPRFETRGDLGGAVSNFRNWLEEKVIDLEVEAGTSSPTVDPSVRTVLVGHSMGGIVAAETVISVTSEKPIYTEDGIEKPANPIFSNLMFPYIQGVLAFDTPYLGISPGVVAHGAEDYYQNAASTISQLSGLGTALWGANASGSKSGNAATSPQASLPAANSKTLGGGAKGDDAAPARAASPWQKWGKVAMYAGAAGAVAAGGAAAWMNREQITEGWSWVSSHLQFVGCLARPEELKKRVACMVKLSDELDVGFATLYTRLGDAAEAKQVSVVGKVLGHNRTFCNLPSKQPGGVWKEAVNNKAKEETWAHMTMFEPKNNPGYEKLSQDAKELIAKWVLQNEWYETSGEDKVAAEATA